MSAETPKHLQMSGFSFENCLKNVVLTEAGFQPLQPMKTVSTIAGIIYSNGVVLGTDTKSTSGPLVSDDNCAKIHYLARNIYCCGTGTLADIASTASLIASHMHRHHLNTGHQVPVIAAFANLKHLLHSYESGINAAILLGGMDKTGPSIYSIYPHGSSDKLPYSAMGSGTLAAISLFESRWKPDLTEEEAKELVRDAIAAGVFNDLDSGSNIDLCVIRKHSVERLRNYACASKKGEKPDYFVKSGNTVVLKTTIEDFDITEEDQIIPNDTY